MKKQVFVFLLMATITTSAFAYFKPAKPILDQVDTNTEEPEALHCKVTNGDITVECWFCDCQALYEKVASQEK